MLSSVDCHGTVKSYTIVDIILHFLQVSLTWIYLLGLWLNIGITIKAMLSQLPGTNTRGEKRKTIPEVLHKAWRSPSIRYGHFVYVFALLLAVVSRRVVIGKDPRIQDPFLYVQN